MDETNKKKAITEAFLQLVEKKPVDKITVKMVIEKCHLSRSTFYYHFRSITELVEYIILETIDKAYRKSLKAKDLKEMPGKEKSLLKSLWRINPSFTRPRLVLKIPI